MSDALSSLIHSIRLSLSSIGLHGYHRLVSQCSRCDPTISVDQFAAVLNACGVQLTRLQSVALAKAFVGPSLNSVSTADFLFSLHSSGCSNQRINLLHSIFTRLDASSTGRISLAFLLRSFRGSLALRDQFAAAYSGAPDQLMLDQFMEYATGISVSVPNEETFQSLIKDAFGVCSVSASLGSSPSVLSSARELIISRLSAPGRIISEHLLSALRKFEFPMDGMLDSSRFYSGLQRAGVPIDSEAADALFQAIANGAKLIKTKEIAAAITESKQEEEKTELHIGRVMSTAAAVPFYRRSSSVSVSSSVSALLPFSASPPALDFSYFSPSNPLLLFIHSPPLGGKSTQLANLAREFPISLVDPRLLIDRELSRPSSRYSSLISLYLSERAALPEELLVQLLLAEISSLLSRGVSCVAVEEFPTSTKGWALIIQEMKKLMNKNRAKDPTSGAADGGALPNPLVLYLAVNDEDLKRGRPSQPPGNTAYAALLADYRRSVDPFLKDLGRSGVLRAVDGSGSIESVYDRMKEALATAKFRKCCS